MSKKQKVIIIYHKVDLDGFSSGSLVKYALSDLYNNNNDYIFLGKNYYDDMNDIKDIIDKDTIVFMTDFSMENEWMQWINDNSKLFVWIDHHISAIEKIDKDLQDNIEGIREVGFAGVELTWKYFYDDKEMPFIIKALGRYDVFDMSNETLSWHDEILPFQYGMMQLNLNPKFDYKYNLWEDWFNFELYKKPIQNNKYTYKKILSNGNAIKEYKSSIHYRNRGLVFECSIGDYNGIALNTNIRSSIEFDKVDDIEKYDFMLCYTFDGEMYGCSIYSKEGGYDVRKIYKGFAGHSHASGMKIDNIFDIINNIKKIAK